ncbi:MAG TPA: zf-HC2 domain-containing protein, partial [Thermomicrobiales bacterium]
MMNRETTEHVADMLPAYLNGTLAAGTAARVEAHLSGCAACRAELAEWRAIAEAAPLLYQQRPIPADTLLSRVWSEVDRAEAETLRRRPALRLAWLWSLLIGQLPLVRRGIWTASALTMALGCVIELFRPYGVGEVLAVVAPVVAAIGIAFVYGPENDPSLEIALATPTSPRLVLMGRLTLVYAYDILLAVTASAAITAARGGMGLWTVTVLWLGP